MEFEFKSILDLVKAFPTEADCIKHLEQLHWNGTPVSPFDETSKVYKCSNNRYKCKNTGKYFNVKVGTIFEDTKIPLIKWFMALYLFSSHKKGISSHQLAKDIDVTQKSAWFILHRLRYAFEHPNFQKQFETIIEIDECYVGGQDRFKHQNKKSNKSGRNNDFKTPVFGMKDRGTGNIMAVVVPNVKAETLFPIIQDQVQADSIVVTDEYNAYKHLNKLYSHAKVRHSAKQYVDGVFHTNGVENYWSHLKRDIHGIYHWLSTVHLQSYVNEYTLRFNTRKFTTNDRFNLVLGNVAGRLTYKELIK